jgi:hypothetical protein
MANLVAAQLVRPAQQPQHAPRPVIHHARAKTFAVVCRIISVLSAMGFLTFTLATGYQCYRDAANNPMCRDPNPPEPSTTYVPPPTTEQETSTYVPPPESSTTYVPPITEQDTSTYVPPPELSTVIISTTRTQVVTQTYQVSNTVTSLTRSSNGAAISGTTTQAGGTGAVLYGFNILSVLIHGTQLAFLYSVAKSSTNVGAIAGGTAAGVIVIVAIVILLILWRRKRASETQAIADPQHPFAYGPSSAPVYHSPGVVPPTPGTGDPFLTPMGQHQNLGVSYFAGATPASPGPSGTGSGPMSQYTGLPEPQQSDVTGAAAGVVAMPVPRHDAHHPRPLPMSVSPMQGAGADAGSPRPWSGYASGPPSSGPNAGAYAGYAESNNSGTQPSRWSSPMAVNTNAGYASPNLEYANPGTAYRGGPEISDTAPSTVYQPSTHAGGHDDAYALRTPPGSPPPSGAYGGMIGTGGNGLPSGAAPPVAGYGSGDEQVYRPY